ncbi:MAG: tripartite tricarboxylate transporter substrate binding protein [Acetobacteraceae bacterium]|nr:MAG: tripartite tricarboxylate transporter substrate binding protein [Acetobacteraceae bacterium]
MVGIDRRAALGLLAAMPGMRAGAQGTPAPEGWPARPVRLIVPYPPGGGADVVARLLAPALSEQPGGPQIVIDNRPGAGGNVGTEQLAKSPPDGYTIGTITIGTHGTNPWLFPRLGFDPVADFSPVALVSLQPAAIVAAAGSGLTSLDDLLALKRETNFASSGNGTSGHLGGEVLRVMGRLPLVHVPYRGSGPAWADLLGGRVELVVDNIQNALPHHQSGRARILALTGTGRVALVPEVPAVRERLPDYLVQSWNGIAGPAGMPAEVVDRLGRLIAAARSPAVLARYAELGMEFPASSPAHLAGFIAAQLAFWKQVITGSNIRLE